jgi:hypothetical protein
MKLHIVDDALGQTELFAPAKATAATPAMVRARGELRCVGVDTSLPFTPGRWTLAASGRSVNLPDGGKIRSEKRGDESRLAADMRLIQAAPALHALAQEFRLFLDDGGAVAKERSQLLRWLDALNAWIATGEERFDAETGGVADDDPQQSEAPMRR